jgi:hypothetical protein
MPIRIDIECDDCGDDIDDYDELYCQSCYDKHFPEIECEQCKEKLTVETIHICGKCWDKRVKPINAQLDVVITEIQESISQMTRSFESVKEQFAKNDKTLDATYMRMSKLNVSLMSLKAELSKTKEATAEEKSEG